MITFKRSKMHIVVFILLLSLIPFNSVFANSSERAESRVELIGGKLNYELPKEQIYDFGKVEIMPKVEDNKPRYQKIKDQTISDSRGTGEGYHLTASATLFTDVDDPSKKLLPGTLSILAPESKDFVKKTNGNYGNGTINIGKRSIDGSSVTLLYATRGTGMGTYQLKYSDKSLEFRIIQPDARRGVYKSTITFTLSSGPGV